MLVQEAGIKKVAERGEKGKKGRFTEWLGFFKYLLSYRVTLLFSLLFLALSSGILMIFPYLTGKLVDAATGKTDAIFTSLRTTVGYMGLAVLCQCVTSYFRVYLFALLTERAVRDIRTQLYDKLVRMPMSFFGRNQTGDLFSRLTSDVAIVQNSFSVTFVELIRQVAILLVGLGLVFSITPHLSLVLLFSSPIFIGLAVGFGKFIRRLTKRTQEAQGRSHGVVEESLQSVSTVKALVIEQLMSRRYQDLQGQALRVALSTAKYRSGFIALIMLVLLGALVGVMWYGTYLVSQGGMSSGDLLSFVLYATFIGGSMAGLGDAYAQLQRATGAARRITEIMDEPAELSDINVISSSHADSTLFDGDICYEGVSFAYPTRPDVQVLRGVDIRIPAGQKVAILGKNGAGKSTLLDLLLRFYEPAKGHILLGKTPLSAVDKDSLRQHIGTVAQHPVLFGGSIEENIRYGRPQATEQELQRALEQAHVSDFLDTLPQGVNTYVGEKGSQLSGGQKQRIALARLILKNPKIVLLDEATSSIDPLSEELIQKTLNTFLKHRTSLIVTHKPHTLRHVDYAYLMEEGKVKDHGSPDKLLQIYFPSTPLRAHPLGDS